MLLLGYVLILILCCIIYGLWCGLYALFSCAVPDPFPTIFTVFIFYHLLLGFCRKITFPGSTWMWKRNLEDDFQTHFVYKYRTDIVLLKTIVNSIQEGYAISPHDIPLFKLKNIAKTFNSMQNVFKKRVAQKNLTEKQKLVIEEFDKLDQALHSTNLVEKTSREKISVWELLTDDKTHVKIMEQDVSFEFEDQEKSSFIMWRCDMLSAKLESITYSNGFFAGLKRGLFEKYLFGTIDHMREELEKLYQCKFISLKGKENNIIDCALISGKKEAMMANSKDQENLEGENKNSSPVMIICGANGGVFEFSSFESQLVELYLKLGFNVFVWNYRGFGRSTGKPDPSALRRDGETIVDYLRNIMGFRVIGCHGESIGGLVATHIARWKNLDFLCADRTFESLLSVGKALAGRGLGVIYRLVTGWDDRVALDFLESKCYKVITFDPNDEVIPYTSSLKYGITSRIVQTRLGITKGEPKKLVDNGPYRIYSPLGWISRIRKLIYSIQKELFDGKINKRLKDNYGSLPKQHVEVLYKALTRLFDIFDIHRKIKYDSLAPQSIPMVRVSGALDFLDPTSQRPNQANNGQIDSEPEMPEVSEIDYSSSLIKEGYDKLYDQDAQKDPELFQFLKNVFNPMREFEVGGVQIKRIMKLKEPQRSVAFKNFLWNLEIWGSYLPLDETLNELAPKVTSIPEIRDYYQRSGLYQLPSEGEMVADISYHQNKSIMKLKRFINRLDYLIQIERKKCQGNYASLRNLILEDLKLVASVLPTIIENAELGGKKDQKEYMNKSEDIELMPVTPKEGLAKPLLESQIDVEMKIGKDYSLTVGHLIPLHCGHNGDMDSLELELYEEYVKHAGLVKK